MGMEDCQQKFLDGDFYLLTYEGGIKKVKMRSVKNENILFIMNGRS
jgi:hypothetical protein